MKKLLDPGLRRMTEEGVAITKKQYLEANLARGAYGSAMRQFMEKYDFLLTPTLATTAFDVGKLSPLDDDGNAWMAWTPFSVPFNLTQQPAATVPAASRATACRWACRSLQDVRRRRRAGRSYAYELADPHYEKTPAGF